MSVQLTPIAAGCYVSPPCQRQIDLKCELNALKEITFNAVSIARFVTESLLKKNESGNPKQINAFFHIEPVFLTHVALFSPALKCLTANQRKHIFKALKEIPLFKLENFHQPENILELQAEFYKYSIRPLYLGSLYQFDLDDPDEFQYQENRIGYLKSKNYHLSQASCFMWAFALAGIPLDLMFVHISPDRLGRPHKVTDCIDFLMQQNPPWRRASLPIQKGDIIFYFKQPWEEPTHAAFAIDSTRVSSKWGNNNHQAYSHPEILTPPEYGPYFLIYRKEN